MDIAMKFCMENVPCLQGKLGKSGNESKTKASTRESIRTCGEKENYKFLEILESDIIKQIDMKRKIRKYYRRGTRHKAP